MKEAVEEYEKRKLEVNEKKEEIYENELTARKEYEEFKDEFVKQRIDYIREKRRKDIMNKKRNTEEKQRKARERRKKLEERENQKREIIDLTGKKRRKKAVSRRSYMKSTRGELHTLREQKYFERSLNAKKRKEENVEEFVQKSSRRLGNKPHIILVKIYFLEQRMNSSKKALKKARSLMNESLRSRTEREESRQRASKEKRLKLGFNIKKAQRLLERDLNSRLSSARSRKQSLIFERQSSKKARNYERSESHKRKFSQILKFEVTSLF